MKNKKICVFSMAPVFKNYVHGGSQKILRELLHYLGKEHIVEVLCTKRKDNNKEFELFPNVVIKPILPFKSTYPEPYYTAPFNLKICVEELNKAIKRNDIIYVHDSEMNFFFLYDYNKPFICSLRDYVYPDTLIGAFNFRRDKVIVNCFLTKENVKHTIGTYMPGIINRIHVIPNGFDLDLFKKTKPKKIKKLIPNLNSKNIILYPHRPDEKKGIFESLELIRRLKYKHNIDDIRLLIPIWVDMNIESGKKSYYGQTYYRAITEFVKKNKIEENVILHPWIPFELMPQYFSLGKLTLCIGKFIESFGGNSSVESVLCGTPVILSKVGAQRVTLPDNLVDKVDPEDIDEIEKKILDILKNGRNLKEAKGYIAKHYNLKKMLESYEHVLVNTKPLPKLKLKFKKNYEKCVIKLAPWCYIARAGRIYNDYLYRYFNLETSIENLIKNKTRLEKVSLRELSKIKDLIKKGILVLEENEK